MDTTISSVTGNANRIWLKQIEDVGQVWNDAERVRICGFFLPELVREHGTHPGRLGAAHVLADTVSNEDDIPGIGTDRLECRAVDRRVRLSNPVFDRKNGHVGTVEEAKFGELPAHRIRSGEGVGNEPDLQPARADRIESFFALLGLPPAGDIGLAEEAIEALGQPFRSRVDADERLNEARDRRLEEIAAA